MILDKYVHYASCLTCHTTDVEYSPSLQPLSSSGTLTFVYGLLCILELQDP